MSITSLQQAFQKQGISLEVNQSQFDTPLDISNSEICRIVHEVGYCAIFSETQFTIVPFAKGPSIAPSVSAFFQTSNERLITSPQVYPLQYTRHFDENKKNMTLHAVNSTGRAVIFGFGNGHDVPIVDLE